MALNGNHQIFHRTTAAAGPPSPSTSLRLPFLIPSWSHPRTHHHNFTIVSASKKSSSPRTGKFDSKNKRSLVSTKEDEEDEEKVFAEVNIDGIGAMDDEFEMPKLPGDEPDFWEGPQWDGFGFFVQYLWAFGIVFALVSSGIAVATYNEGATDFKNTPAYKESIQSQELLEEPEASNSDVFESNPTEQAPTLE